MHRPPVRTPKASGSSGCRRWPPAAISFWLTVVAVTLCINPAPRAGRASAATPTRESQITAVFLFNFAQFVEWPADAFTDSKAPLEIGVVSADTGVAESLTAAVQGKSVGGHPLAVRHFATPGEARACHVLYVEGVPPADVDRLIERFRKSPVLTVGSASGFAAAGGVIRLFTEDNKMRFEVNLRAMESARLKISSQLLKMSSNH